MTGYHEARPGLGSPRRPTSSGTPRDARGRSTAPLAAATPPATVAAARPARALAAASLALALLTGCPGKPCPTTPHADADLALAAHRSMRRPARVMRAEARVEQWGRDGRIRGTVMMFVARPESVRFDAMTQFGPAAILTSDGERFALTDLREDRYLTGPTCPQNIARLLGIPMSGAEVALLLLGDTPRIEAASSALVCTGDGTYLVTIAGVDGRKQEIELEIRDHDRRSPPSEQRLRILRSEVFERGGRGQWRTQWRATFSDHRVVRDPRSEEGMGVAMPFEIRFEHPRQRADTTVRFEDIDLNVEVPEAAFVQQPRPGIVVEQVLCE